MVDAERRAALKRMGIWGGVLLGGSSATYHGWEWWSDRDNRIDPGETEGRVVRKLQKGVNWGDHVQSEEIRAALEPAGKTPEGGIVYDATVTAPFGTDPDIDAFWDYTDNDDALADILFQDASLLFRGLYAVYGKHRTEARRPEEDQVQSFTVSITDETGEAGFTFDAATAEQIARGGTLGGPEKYEPGWRAEEKQRFRRAYREHFTVRDGGASRIDVSALEQAVETALQAVDVDAYDAIVLGGIDAALEPVETDGDATIYEANIEAPISQDAARTPCSVAGNTSAELELAGDLVDDAEKLFDGLYDTMGRHRQTVRDADDDRIRTYRVTIDDGEGAMTATFDARTVDRIAGSSGSRSTYEPDNADEHARFRQAYFDAISVSC